MTARLAGRTAVVTGASRGIGLATARALARDGAQVVLIARDTSALRSAASEIPRALAIACDVRDQDAVDRAIARLAAELGTAPDVLVSSAGAFQLARVEHTTPAAMREALDVNLLAPFLFVRALLPAFRARGRGHLVIIGSVADRSVFPENAAYAASKHGVRALHEVIREELRGSGIRATLVSPGPTDTALWDSVDPDNRHGFTPRAAMLRSDHVAAAVLFAITQPPEVNVDELRLSPA